MPIRNTVGLLLSCALLAPAASVKAADWQPVEGHIMTRWAEKVRPENAWPEYPRPKMVRKEWVNLNGLWDYAIRPAGETLGPNGEFKPAAPESWDGRILVPFCVESALSGVKKRLTPKDALWYRRTFEVPGKWQGQRVLLHFGAVDWHCAVWVNGKQAGSHKGGYDPFDFDITDALKEGANEVIVAVMDPTTAGTQPRGKQHLNPKGIWYSPVSGIWQTVWLEPVEKTYIRSLKIVPDVDAGAVRVTVEVAGAESPVSVWVKAAGDGRTVAEAKGKSGVPVSVTIETPKLWSPDSPFLYDLEAGIEGGDKVGSYFGMRKIGMAKDDNGILRMTLNGRFLFQIGPLDQGWWPDGLYTAPTDEALAYDLEVIKKLGMNMLRKHVKIEPARLYYHCDRLGLLVWQDMVSGRARDEESKQQFRLEIKRMVDSLHNHPCIIMWVLFNEGWGQHDTGELSKWVKDYDPTRLVNPSSGFNREGPGDVRDVHMYPGPAMPALEDDRVAVLGEFGGLGLPVPGHLWQSNKSWGYVNLKAKEELQNKFDALIGKLQPLIAKGLCAAVYTQTSDCEGEVNGLLTYDREVLKLDAEHTAHLLRELIESASSQTADGQ